MKTRKRSLSAMLIVIILINIICPITKAETCSLGNDIQLRGYGSVECHVRNSENGDYAIVTDLVGYYENGKFYPAYCLNRGSKGADGGYVHTVNIFQLLANKELYNKIWRIIMAGYPNHTAEELNVDDWTYAYQATKTAIYHVVGEYSDKAIEKTNVNNYYGIDETGKRTVALMKRLVNEAENGTNTYKEPEVIINKVGNMELKDMHYVQRYKVTSNVTVKTYKISIEGFPNGTEITNIMGIEKSQFNGGESFEVRIPKDIVEQGDVQGRILLEMEAKVYAMFYGKTYNQAYQNYAITANPVKTINSSEDFETKGNTASIKIYKVDKETNQPIEGTKYELIDSKGNVIGQATTDTEGVLTFNELYQDTYTLKEIKSNDNYIVSTEAIDIKATYNKITEQVLTNEHKKGI